MEDRTRKFPRFTPAPTFSGAALSGSDPQDPKKVVRTPKKWSGPPDSRESAVFPDSGVLDPRKPGFPAEMDQIPQKRPFSRFPGGARKVESCPQTPGLFQKTTDYNLCHPHGICAFLGKSRYPSPPHGRASFSGGRAGQPRFASFFAKIVSNSLYESRAAGFEPLPPQNGRFPTFWGPDRLFGVPGPGIRESGVLDQESGVRTRNPGSGRPGIPDPGPKKSRTGTPLPGTVRPENPGTRKRKKIRSTPKKKVIPQKKETGPHYKPPPANNIGHS